MPTYPFLEFTSLVNRQLLTCARLEWSKEVVIIFVTRNVQLNILKNALPTTAISKEFRTLLHFIILVTIISLFKIFVLFNYLSTLVIHQPSLMFYTISLGSWPLERFPITHFNSKKNGIYWREFGLYNFIRFIGDNGDVISIFNCRLNH